MKLDKSVLFRLWSVSTLHIRQSTATALDEALKNGAGVLYDCLAYHGWAEQGWLFMLGDDTPLTCAELMAAGYSDLARLIEEASHIKAEYLLLYEDGLQYDELPTFED